MRLPLAAPLETRDGETAKDPRLTNCLVEQESSGPMVAIRPGLTVHATTVGTGRGITTFNGTLLSVYGANLSPAKVETFDITYGDLGFGYASMVYGLVGNLKGFVAVKTDNTDSGAFSADEGLTWQSFTLPTIPGSSEWDAVGASSERFVALSQYGVGAYSDNGTTWIQTTPPTTNNTINKCTYGGNRFVAVYSGNKCLYSLDGVTWVQANMPTTALWYGVAWNGTVFCAVARNSSIAATSPDGITWTQRVLPRVAFWNDIAAVGNLFCAVGGAAGHTAVSTDGISWTEGFLPETILSPGRVAATVDVFAVVGETEIAFSADGLTWDAYFIEGAGAWVAIASNGVRFVATSYEETAETAARIQPPVGKLIASLPVSGDFFDFTQSTL